MPDDDMINMHLHELTPMFYDRRADLLAGIALDDDITAECGARFMREAQAIFQRARAHAPRAVQSINVRANVVDVLRRIGGAR
jgi:hypothetical protein